MLKKLQQKFSVYQTEAERDGKRTLTLFTREQTERLLAVRENGERTPLSYDEILFLINDSIRLYERCDEIVLTGLAPGTLAVCDGNPCPIRDRSLTLRYMPQEILVAERR